MWHIFLCLISIDDETFEESSFPDMLCDGAGGFHTKREVNNTEKIF